MTEKRVFGYGSLVNAKTHDYQNCAPVSLTGWRRLWRHTKLRSHAFLSVEPVEGSTIEGLVATVPAQDWEGLDERETNYFRSDLTPCAFQPTLNGDAIVMYQAETGHDVPEGHIHPIFQSYLDVVLQGYLEVFGEDGVHRFFNSTHGWDAPILNDRSFPFYPRAQSLSADELAFVDECVATYRLK